MKMGQISDLHYCPEHLGEVDKCVSFAVDRMISELCEVAVISGDLFDHRVDLHDPCVYALMKRVKKLADHMPVLILQGTFSHDTPGSLNVFKTLGGVHPVHVVDSIGQVVLVQNMIDEEFEWFPCPKGYTFEHLDFGKPVVKALFSCLPPVNKGQIAALNTDDAAAQAGEYVYQLMRGWSVINEQAASSGIPTVIVAHGTVNGSMTEQGVPMHGNDWEMSTGSMFASKASAILLGHIHQMQTWSSETGQTIAYPGSPGRLHFGELTDKGFLIWDVQPTSSTTDFITTPAKKLLQIDFTEEPDIEKLKAMAETAYGAHVRVRYEVNEEDRDSVNKDEIKAIFGDSAELKIESRIKPITRTRAEGINKAHSLDEKLKVWCESTGNELNRMAMRLDDIAVMEPDVIVQGIISCIEGDTNQDAAA